MLLSVDLGFGYTKALANKDKDRAIFPSVIAPAGEGAIFDMGGDLPGHMVEIRFPGSTKRNRLYIGELAARDGRAAQLSFGRDRFARDASLVLTLAAADLVGADGRVALGFGLPLSHYAKLKGDVANALQGVSAHVSVDGGREHVITFSEVHVFPQGVGAFYNPKLELPTAGLYGLVDIGFYTTDYLLVEIGPTGLLPFTEHMSSVEIGVSTALKLFGDRFRRETGRQLTLMEVAQIWKKPYITFSGSKMPLMGIAEDARAQTAKAIDEAVRVAWAEKIDFVDGLVLAGGGAIEFQSALWDSLPAVSVAPDSQFANAVGFMEILKQVATPSVNRTAITSI